MSIELNDRCEDYGMKININKTKAMVIGRKPKKIMLWTASNTWGVISVGT